MNKSILIFDDDVGERRQFVEELKKTLVNDETFVVSSLSDEEFKDALEVLETRRALARQSKSENFEKTCCFDSAAIFIVESDLIPLKTSLTGEFVAQLVRCFSHCGLILGVNQYGTNQFDLTLKNHPESFADVNVGSKQLALEGLWKNRWSGFRPWHWPLLPKAQKDFEQRVVDLSGKLNEPIFDFLQIPRTVSQLFPREVIEFVASKRGLKDYQSTTFAEFLKESPHGLLGKDVKAMQSLPDSVLCRIAASRIGKWIDRLLLAGQEIIVDAPHLIRRFPSLLVGDQRGLDAFNATVGFDSPEELRLDLRKLNKFQFPATHWGSRPTWFWEELRKSEEVLEVRDPWSREDVDWEFCEDGSSFFPRSECRPFEAELPSSDTRRFIRSFEGVDYEPQVRFAL